MTETCEAALSDKRSLSPPPRAEPGVTVRVWLFGALSALAAERPMILQLPSGIGAGDVIDAVGRRLGRPFLDQVLSGPDSLYRCCRLFANGHPVSSLSAPLAAGESAVEIELLLLMGYEGG